MGIRAVVAEDESGEGQRVERKDEAGKPAS